MKVLNFGSCNIDYVYDVEHIVLPGETIPTSGMSVFPGGKGLNQSIAVAKSGAKIYHAGCIGKDGDLLKNTLVANGVDVTYLKMLDAKTGHAIIQLSSVGENSIFLYGGCNELISNEFVDQVLKDFSAGDILILQNEINNLSYIIDRAYERGLKIVFNTAPFKQNVLSIDRKKLEYLIVNQIEAEGLGGKSLPEENINQIKKTNPKLKIVLTLGKQGGIYSDENQTFYYPSFKAEVKDTTAAGDTFLGYFIASIVKGKSVAKALKTAAAASAICVSRKGAATSIPYIDEVEKAMLSMTQNFGRTRQETLQEKISLYLDNQLRFANIEGLAKEIGYSVEYAGVVVKKVMGETFSELLKHKRCDYAAKLLFETELSVQEIIYQCGYENQSFFRKVFKQRFGVSPLKYRKSKTFNG